MISSKENSPSNPTIFINFVLDIESTKESLFYMPGIPRFFDLWSGLLDRRARNYKSDFGKEALGKKNLDVKILQIFSKNKNPIIKLIHNPFNRVRSI